MPRIRDEERCIGSEDEPLDCTPELGRPDAWTGGSVAGLGARAGIAKTLALASCHARQRRPRRREDWSRQAGRARRPAPARRRRTRRADRRGLATDRGGGPAVRTGASGDGWLVIS